MAMIAFIYIFTYTNSVLIACATAGLGYRDGVIQYTRQIQITIIVQTLLPYVEPIFKILLFKCCPKRKPSTPQVLKIERKYALYLILCTLSFFYGLFIPSVFIVTMLSFFIQYIADRLMITYLVEFPHIHDDLLNIKFLRVLKYTPLLYVPSVLSLILFLSIFPYQAQVQDDSSRSYAKLIKL